MNATYDPTRAVLFSAAMFAAIWFGLVAAVQGMEAWADCYVASIVLAGVYLALNRHRLFRVTPLLVAITLVANVFPAIPYLWYDYDPVAGYGTSLYINSFGLIVLLTVASLRMPVDRQVSMATRSPPDVDQWSAFVRANARLYVMTLAAVLLVMYLSEGWKVYFGGLQEGEFSRTANFKGLGPLMIFTAANVYSATTLSIAYGARRRYLAAFGIASVTLLLNGFSLGRGNMIFMASVAMMAYSLHRPVTLKLILGVLLGGVGVVLLQFLRATGVDEVEYSAVSLFLKFSADFDSLNNVGHLVEYIRRNGFPGWFHIYSFLIEPLPRALFPSKPHFIGILHLNDLVFPGLYRGGEGGSNFTFGLYGTWYAASGLASLILGMVATGTFTTWLDMRIDAVLRRPDHQIVFITYYSFVVGQTVILYRDGLSLFMNILIYPAAYLVLCRMCGATIAVPPSLACLFRLRSPAAPQASPRTA